MFIKENLNPKGYYAGDCVIRSIAKATEQTWEAVYEELCKIGIQKKRMPNDSLVYSAYLKKQGWTKVPDSELKFANGERLRIFNIPTKFLDDTYIIKATKHLTVMIDEKIYDTWDCTDHCVYGLWKKTNS